MAMTLGCFEFRWRSIFAEPDRAIPATDPGASGIARHDVTVDQAETLDKALREFHAPGDRMIEPHLDQLLADSKGHQALCRLARHTQLSRDDFLGIPGDIVEPSGAGGIVQAAQIVFAFARHYSPIRLEFLAAPFDHDREIRPSVKIRDRLAPKSATVAARPGVGTRRPFSPVNQPAQIREGGPLRRGRLHVCQGNDAVVASRIGFRLREVDGTLQRLRQFRRRQRLHRFGECSGLHCRVHRENRKYRRRYFWTPTTDPTTGPNPSPIRQCHCTSELSFRRSRNRRKRVAAFAMAAAWSIVGSCIPATQR